MMIDFHATKNYYLYFLSIEFLNDKIFEEKFIKKDK